MSQRLAGKRAIVTGAARGIGRAIAGAFAAEGADLLLADIDTAAVERAAAELDAEALTLDVSRKAEIERLFAQAAAKWGGLDLLVNNAGIMNDRAAEEKILSRTPLGRCGEPE